MDVLQSIVKKTSLNGMPIWYKATTLFLFSTIIFSLITMLFILLICKTHANISYGY